MRALTWFVRLILFLLLFGLALNNLEPTVLHLLFGMKWQAPLFVLLLGSFVLGALVGIAVMLPAWLRARRPRPRPEAPRPAAPAQAAPAVASAPVVIDGSADGV